MITCLCEIILSFMENAFDSLKFFDELKAAEVPERQSRVQAEALRTAFASHDASRMKELATKGDLRETELRLQKEILELENRLDKRIENSKHEMLKWMIGAMIAQTALLVAIFAFLK